MSDHTPSPATDGLREAIEALAAKWASADGEPLTSEGLAVLSTVNRLGRELAAVLAATDATRGGGVNPLASMCPCGHAAFHHPTPDQQSMQLARTGGKYAGECKGGTGVHCRCITDRQQVIAAAQVDVGSGLTKRGGAS